MNRSELLFVGIGQAGNNMVSEVLKTNKRYNGLFINTSYDDIKGIDNAVNTFVVPAAGGTARNRDKAKLYVKNYIYSIVDEIKKFPMQKTLYITFSMGGGTGSGIAPALINVLGKTNPDLNINVIAILPLVNESKKAHENTLECWNELVKLDNIGSFYLIDNNKREDKLDINKEFANLFNSFMNTTEANRNGVIDQAEVGLLGNARGFGAIYKLDECIDSQKSLIEEVSDSIFVVGGNINCKYIGLSIKEGFDYNSILDIYNISEDYFIGYTDDSPLMIISGIKITNKAMAHVKNNLEIKQADLMRNEKENEINDVDLGIEFKKINKSTSKTKEKAKKEEFDLDSIGDEDSFWDSVLNM